MATSITAITDVEAVNRILSTVGGEKVASLSNLSLIADIAYQDLKNSMRDFMSHPWGFNTQYDVELEADDWGQITIDSTNLFPGGANFDHGHWMDTGLEERGFDGMPGPLGVGHAYHWGSSDSPSSTAWNLYKAFGLTTALDDGSYYTASVYVKYHSASTTALEIKDTGTAGAVEKNSSRIDITWNTDGTISNSSTTIVGAESATDSTDPPLSAASYVDVGGGWYRLIATKKIENDFSEYDSSMVSITPNAYPDGEATNGFTYLWGPQLTKGAYVASYAQNMYASDFIASIDLAASNAGNLDVVIRAKQYIENPPHPYDAVTGEVAKTNVRMLFDRKSNSFNAFSGKYKAKITYYLDFIDMPEAAKMYAIAMAAVNFQASQIGNAQIDQILRAQLVAAKAAFESYEAAQESWSIWDNYDLFKIVNASQRPVIGGGSPTWWGTR